MLQIVRNSLIFRTDSWDIDFRGSTLTVREAARKIFFEIDFQPPNRVVVERARFLCNGIELLVRKTHVFVPNSGALMSGNTSIGCDIGLQLGRSGRGLIGGYTAHPTATSRYFMDDVAKRERKALRKNRD